MRFGLFLFLFIKEVSSLDETMFESLHRRARAKPQSASIDPKSPALLGFNPCVFMA